MAVTDQIATFFSSSTDSYWNETSNLTDYISYPILEKRLRQVHLYLNWVLPLQILF